MSPPLVLMGQRELRASDPIFGAAIDLVNGNISPRHSTYAIFAYMRVMLSVYCKGCMINVDRPGLNNILFSSRIWRCKTILSSVFWGYTVNI